MRFINRKDEMYQKISCMQTSDLILTIVHKKFPGFETEEDYEMAEDELNRRLPMSIESHYEDLRIRVRDLEGRD